MKARGDGRWRMVLLWRDFSICKSYLIKIKTDLSWWRSRTFAHLVKELECPASSIYAWLKQLIFKKTHYILRRWVPYVLEVQPTWSSFENWMQQRHYCLLCDISSRKLRLGYIPSLMTNSQSIRGNQTAEEVARLLKLSSKANKYLGGNVELLSQMALFVNSNLAWQLWNCPIYQQFPR